MRKAQFYYVEFMVTLTLFIFVLAIFANAFADISQSKGYDDISLQADSISGQLMSEGSPKNWTQANVQKIGITSGRGRIDEQKLLKFANMSYANAKEKFNLNYDYYVFLENSTGSRIPVAGKQGIGLLSNSSKTLVKVVRFPIYKSDIVRLIVYVWQ